MSFLDSIKQSALDVLHATANALHAQFASTLAQAGHPVTADDHVDTLVQTAVQAAAATGTPQAAGVAPNYADHALASFSTSMTAALLQFAQQHLPSKFLGIAQTASDVVTSVASGSATAASIEHTVLEGAAAAASALIPGAAPIAAIVAPMVEAAISAPAETASAAVAAVTEQAAPVVAAVAATATAAVEAKAEEALPGAGALVGSLISAVEQVVMPSTTDVVPPTNTQGM
jgi:hypothetical protein